MVRNSLTVVAYSDAALFEEIRKSGHRRVPDQVKYLARYCESLGSRTIVTENHYIDRHYLDEFALYYCRNLNPPPNHVRRLHVFGAEFTDERFAKLLSSVLAQRPNDEDKKIIESYLGFVSIRPVHGVPVGRTILRCPPPDTDPAREIEATDSHDIHLANLELKVDGLPFQQQDRAVGACATAALWSAVGRVSRRDGFRSPTPAEVTQAAARHILAEGRSLPAANKGLTVDQLCEAVRCCNLAAETVSAEDHIAYFAAALHAYLRSGIPVLLALVHPETGEGHAVTVAGFQLSDDPDASLESVLPFRSARLKKVYVHDDRLGPYARAHIKPMPYSEDYGEWIRFRIDDQEWILSYMLAPVYTKLRLSVKSLIELAIVIADPVEFAIESVGEAPSGDLSLEFEYQRSGRFLRELNGRIESTQVEFVRSASLSRWCAIMRWYLGETSAFEFVWDTTDIRREDGRCLLRAVLCLDGRYTPELRTIADQYCVPFASV